MSIPTPVPASPTTAAHIQPTETLTSANTYGSPASGRKTVPRPMGPPRQLRARASEPSQSAGAGPSSTYRQPTERELELIHRRLGEDGVTQKRKEVLLEKEGELKKVVDEHDDAVREKFHLERFISILEGWDPRVAKQDQSPVFLEYKQAGHDLMDLVPDIASSSQAGPSRQFNAPSRKTRRQAHEQADLFNPVNPTAPPVALDSAPQASARPKLVGQDGGTAQPRGKGKGRATEFDQEQVNLFQPTLTGPSIKKGRRVTLGIPEQEVEDNSLSRGKKRGRTSLPNLSLGKKSRVDMIRDEESGSASPSTETPPPTTTPLQPLDGVPASPSTPIIRPSLAHIPFPKPPVRPKVKRRKMKMWYTDPEQLPPEPQYGGQLDPILDSYILLEDVGLPPSLKTLEERAAREGFLRNRVNWLQSQGRLLRLLEDEDDPTQRVHITSKTNSTANKGPALPPRKTDHQDSLLSHMVQVRIAMLNEAKSKPVVSRRIAKMIQNYWEHLEGKEERERQSEEKERRRIGKDLMKALRKRWALAVKIVRAQMIQREKAEQDRLGKQHLQEMLKRSTGLLEAQRDDIVGVENGDEADSEGTEDVSEAEDSEDEGSEEGDDEGEDEGGDEQEGGDDDDFGNWAAQDDADLINGNGHAAVSAEDQDAGEEGDHPLDIPVKIVDQSEEQDQDMLDHSALDASDDGSFSSDDDDQSESNDETGTAALLFDTFETNILSEEPNGHAVGLDMTDALPLVTDDVASAPETASPPALHIANGSSIPMDSEAIEIVPAPKDDTSEPLEIAGPSSTTNGHPRVTDEREQLSSSQLPKSQPKDTLTLQVTSAEEIDDAPSLHQRVPSTNGHISPRMGRSRRIRKSISVLPLTNGEDPDVDDVEFEHAESDLEDEDHDLDVEMEGDEQERKSEDSEDEGLLKDADIPIEELLQRYGYQASKEQIAAVTNGVDSKSEIPTDKSLLDEALHAPIESPSLIIEGKRQRRARVIWTPEDNPPPPPKRAKVEVVEEKESTPEFTTSEEDDDDDDEDAAEDVEDQDEDPNKVKPPFLLRGTLRPYQQGGLEWLASLYANNMNGILADEMGLGKTIQTIALLGHLACDKQVWGQHLIIVPTSVILNWEMEFKKFLPGLKILTYYGNQKERKDKRIGWHTENAWQVCITSYQIVLADQHIFRRKSWVYMILDEAHNIKNFRSQRWQTLLGFKAQRRLLLTGTPLQNNLMELWSLLYFLMPNGINADATAVVGFANHKEFMEWFSNPMDKAVENGDALDEDTLATVAKLHTLLRPFILRRLKSEVETQLPGKFEHVVYCRLSKRQRFLYDEFMSRASTKEALSSGGYLGVVNTLMQLRKVCNHPDLFEVRPVRTSFAMEKSVVGDFAPADLIVRKRLLQRQDELNLDALNLNITANESMSGWASMSRKRLDASQQLPHAIEVVKKGRQPAVPPLDTLTVEGWAKYRRHQIELEGIAKWRSLRDVNRRRCAVAPIYGSTFVDMLTCLPNTLPPLSIPSIKPHPFGENVPPASALIASLPERFAKMEPVVNLFAVAPPNAVARDVSSFALPGLDPTSHPSFLDPEFDTLHPATVKLQIAFPDSSLLQYDCGKLQKLYDMLRDLKAGGHRVLIFTQMTRVLDILEIFLSYNGHRYLRLDGSTKIEDRQIITERFNSDPRIFVFIASSRSGGVGINLTGADTVFFYDSDWNPSMDRQCMDRAHRIGQTREVHIYRFVSSHTIEENMLKKANQKRLLDKVVIQQGDFTTDFFGKMDWKDLIDDSGKPGTTVSAALEDEDEDRVVDIEVEAEPEAEDAETTAPRIGVERDLARALAEVEDEEDAAAARIAQGEGEMDFAEFDEGAKKAAATKRVGFESNAVEGTSATPVPDPEADRMDVDGEQDEVVEEEDDVGAVDEYMLKWVEADWPWFVSYRA